MQELLLVNPARRPSKRRKTTKAASPAQKRARAAFAARARARAGKPRKAAKRRASSKPHTALTIMSNPRKRRSVKRSSRRRSNPIKLGGFAKKPMAIITPALIGAVGATVVNTVLGRLPLPAAAMTGKARYVTQGAAAILLSIIAAKVGVKGSTATQMAEGSLTVTLHQAITDIASGAGMNLSGMGYYLPGVGARGAVPSRAANSAPMAMNGMAQYITGPGSPRSAGLAGMGSAGRSARKVSGFGF